MYIDAWNWPSTTAVVGLISMGWFLLGILVGRRLPQKAAKQRNQEYQGRRRREEPQRAAPSGGDVELYVGNLSYETTESELRDLFGKSGAVASVRLIENKFSGKSKGYAFLEMGNAGQAQAAIRALNGKEYKGRKIVVNEAKSRSRA